MKTLGVLCLSNRGLYEGADPDFGQGMADPRRYKIPNTATYTKSLDQQYCPR